MFQTLRVQLFEFCIVCQFLADNSAFWSSISFASKSFRNISNIMHSKGLIDVLRDCKLKRASPLLWKHKHTHTLQLTLSAGYESQLNHNTAKTLTRTIISIIINNNNSVGSGDAHHSVWETKCFNELDDDPYVILRANLLCGIFRDYY